MIRRRAKWDIRKVLYVLKTTFVRFWRDNCFVKAAALSYSAFLTFIPIAILLIVSLGIFLKSNDTALKYILNQIQGFTPAGFDSIKIILENTLKGSRSSTIFGFTALVWLALLFFGMVENIINTIWRIQKRRSFLKSKIFGLFLITLLIFFLLANFFVSNLANKAILSIKMLKTINYNVLYGLNLILSGIAFFLINKFVPVTRVNWKAAFWGSLCTVFLAELARTFYRFYLYRIPHISLLYGSILTASILIVWLDYTMLTILFGCELTKTIHQELR
jgi:membrane protein